MILTIATLALISCGTVALAQQLNPRAYAAYPTGVNVLNVNHGYSFGDLSFDPSLPIDSSSANIHGTALGYFRSVNILNRSANFSVALPYALGHLRGNYLGQFTEIYRSGLTDAATRFAINLYGAPAMKLPEMAKYRQKTNVGVSIIVSAPTGQYDPNKAINIGANRWAFRPELGVSHRIRDTRWLLDAYAGLWLFTANHNFQGRTRTQKPISSFEFHISRDLTPRLWLAFDANFFTGGRTSIDGAPRNDLQRNSRVGATISIPVRRRQAVKFSYAIGAYTTIGGDFQTLSCAYQYVWGGGL